MNRCTHIPCPPLALRTVVGSPSIVLACALVLSLLGCVERRVWIESTPPGALVWLNDAQVGRTPVDVAITHHGVYDIRREKEGYEPLITSANTDGPAWDTAPLDLGAELMPMKFKCEARWSFTLWPRDDSEIALVDRATALRDRLLGESAAASPTGEQLLKQLQNEVEGKAASETAETADDDALLPSALPVPSSPGAAGTKN